jgi:hypothetical protein
MPRGRRDEEERGTRKAGEEERQMRGKEKRRRAKRKEERKKGGRSLFQIKNKTPISFRNIHHNSRCRHVLQSSLP